MKRLLDHRPSPAMVVACLALLIALGGVGVAATRLPANSVGTVQLKNDAVTAAKVKNGSLVKADFKRGQIVAGPAGATGPAGPTGPAGALGEKGEKGDTGSNAFGSITFVRGPDTTLLQSQYANAEPIALCPADQVPLGGGAETPNGYYTQMGSSKPHRGASGTPDGWQVEINHRSGYDYPYTVNAWVICAKATQVTGP